MFSIIAQAAAPIAPTQDWFSVLSWAGVVSLFMTLWLTGRLFSKSVVDDKDKQIEFERERADIERARADKADETIREFAKAAELTNHILSEIKSRVEKT